MSRKQRWHLVVDMRSILMTYWGPLAGLNILLVIVQMILRRYEGELEKPVCWLLFNIAPASILLLSSTWLNKNPQKLVSPEALRTLVFITVCHGLLSLLSIMLMPFVVGLSSAGTYLLKSLAWLSLSNAFLIGGYSILFFKKENKIQPSPEIITNIALAEQKKAAKNGNNIRQICLDFIAKGDFREALTTLKEHIRPNDENINEVILLESRFSSVENQIHTGTVDTSTAQIEINKIALALLHFSKLIR